MCNYQSVCRLVTLCNRPSLFVRAGWFDFTVSETYDITVFSFRWFAGRCLFAINCGVTSYTYLLTPWSRVLLEKLTGSAASQEILCILWNPKVLHRTHKYPSPLPILSQIYPVPTPTSWKSILILSSHLRLGLPSGLFPTRTLCTPLPSPIRATCPTYLILLDFTTRTILVKEYRSPSSSLCNFLHSP